MVIGPHQLQIMIEQARAEFPNEACGMLAGNGGRALHVYPVRNADQSPIHFTMDAHDQLATMKDMDERDWELVGIYHSHTRTRAYPSATDIRMAKVALRFYPDAVFVIVSLADPESPDIRAFRIADESVIEVPVTVA